MAFLMQVQGWYKGRFRVGTKYVGSGLVKDCRPELRLSSLSVLPSCRTCNQLSRQATKFEQRSNC